MLSKRLSWHIIWEITHSRWWILKQELKSYFRFASILLNLIWKSGLIIQKMIWQYYSTKFVHSNYNFTKKWINDYKDEQNEIQDYLKDASNTRGFCEAVVYPESKDDVIAILKNANEKNTKVTVCGNRTGLSAGSVPNGGIVLSTEKLNKILEINEKEKYAVVEPGVLLSDFYRLLNL